jgi:hypothetical protein
MKSFEGYRSYSGYANGSDKKLWLCEVDPSCGGKSVFLKGKTMLPDGNFVLELMCPDCNVLSNGIYTGEQLGRFERELLKAEKVMKAVDLQHAARDAEIFAIALDHDLIFPQDITG